MRYLEIAAERKRGPEWTALRDVEKYDKSGVEVYDMTNLPIKGYEDNTFDGIYSEHFIEHIFKYQGLNYLKECLRLLKPGGIVRTIWPPYDFVEKLISTELEGFCGRYIVRGKGHFIEPDHNSLNRWIFVPPKDRLEAKDGDFVASTLTKHPYPSGKAQAKITKIIGKIR